MKTETPELEKNIEEDTGLKQLVVNYIGTQLDGPDDITVEMAVQVFASEFPEFLLAIAEENFIRGYQQALDDLESSVQQQTE
jgi:hypothetical protein|tara:strand:- start:126 stop:371 length:246 start_codon:yes stop_codon:yes gene_type:complete